MGSYLVVFGIAAALVGVFWRWPFDKDHMMVAATVILAIVAIAQAYILYTTDRTLRLTLGLAHRPWVGVKDIEIVNGWPAQVDGKIQFDLAVELKNVGKSPGIVLVFAEVILYTDEWRQTQKTICDSVRAKIRAEGFGDHWAILPEHTWPFHVRNRVLSTPIATIQEFPGGKYDPMIVGCVAYRSTFTTELYMTPFVARISVENPKILRDRDDINHPRIGDLAPPEGMRLIVKAISMAGESPR